MGQMRLIFTFLFLLGCFGIATAQMDKSDRMLSAAQTGTAVHQQQEDQGAAPLDAQREKRALQVLFKVAQTKIVSAADAMPADKYGFAPTDGEFKGGANLWSGSETSSSDQFYPGGGRTGREPADRCRRRDWT
jgi:hypothetical protein